MPAKILIVGGTGFVGQHVLPRLQQAAPEDEFVLFVTGTAETPPNIRSIRGSLQDTDSLSRAMATADGLICLLPFSLGFIPKLVELCERNGVKRALFLGTPDVFNRRDIRRRYPLQEAEKAIQNSLLDWTLLRPTMIYGQPGDRTIERLAAYLRRMPVIPVPFSLLNHYYQPLHVDDLAQGLAAAFYSDTTYRKAYNLSGRTPIRLRDLIHMTARGLGRRVFIIAVPSWPMRFLLHMYTKLLYSPAKGERRLMQIMAEKAQDHSLARRDFGFKPRPFQLGLEVFRPQRVTRKQATDDSTDV